MLIMWMDIKLPIEPLASYFQTSRKFTNNRTNPPPIFTQGAYSAVNRDEGNCISLPYTHAVVSYTKSHTLNLGGTWLDIIWLAWLQSSPVVLGDVSCFNLTLSQWRWYFSNPKQRNEITILRMFQVDSLHPSIHHEYVLVTSNHVCTHTYT